MELFIIWKNEEDKDYIGQQASDKTVQYRSVNEGFPDKPPGSPNKLHRVYYKPVGVNRHSYRIIYERYKNWQHYYRKTNNNQADFFSVFIDQTN